MAFTLTKWYVDVVTGEGRVAIAYWAKLHAGGVGYAACGLQYGAGATTPAFSLRAGHGPRLIGDRLVWHTPALQLDVSLLRLAPDIATRLYESEDGAVDWCAWAPAAHVRVAVGDEVFEGEGYVDRLDLTMAPWSIPMRTLRWGRFVGGNRSAVWIEWEGTHPLAVAWLDGLPVTDLRVDEDVVSLGEGRRIDIADRAVITDATVGEQLTTLPMVRTIIDRIDRSYQVRWRCRGTLTIPDHPPVSGWVVHERVSWS